MTLEIDKLNLPIDSMHFYLIIKSKETNSNISMQNFTPIQMVFFQMQWNGQNKMIFLYRYWIKNIQKSFQRVQRSLNHTSLLGAIWTQVIYLLSTNPQEKYMSQSMKLQKEQKDILLILLQRKCIPASIALKSIGFS